MWAKPVWPATKATRWAFHLDLGDNWSEMSLQNTKVPVAEQYSQENVL